MSCSSIGPKQVHLDRGAYNAIVRQTDYEQLLMNIVRMSYSEPTSYMSITNLTSSYSLTQSGSLSPSFSRSTSSGPGIPPNWNVSNSIGISPNISYSDSPTISYVPVDDQVFVTTMHEPVAFNAVIRLYLAGIDDLSLTKLIFRKVGDIENASSATIPKDTGAPVYKPFYELVAVLNEMQKNKLIIIGAVEVNQMPCFRLTFTKGSANSPQAKWIKKILQVAPDSQSIIFMQRQRDLLELNANKELVATPNAAYAAKNLVFVETRSLYGVLAFLSHAVQIPPEDFKNKFVAQYTNPDGTVFDWTVVMKDLMTIYSSDKEPQNAFVKCFFNQHWFYIKDTDITSKVTFGLVIRLMTLTAAHGAIAASGPMLTVPVGAPR